MKQQILQKAIDDTTFYLDLLFTDINEKRLTKDEIARRVQAINKTLKIEST